MQKIKILIVDDHYLIRSGLRTVLEMDNNQYKFLIEEAKNGEEAVAKVKKSNYNIVIMDYHMPKLNGVEATLAILHYNPNIPILALSFFCDCVYIKSFLKAGAKGYILKDGGPSELIIAITTILNGKSYFSNEVALTLLNAKRKRSEIKISEKEISVLKFIAKGHTSQEIADKLFISKYAIDKHRQQLLKKMQVNNSVNLLRQAKKLKLID